MPTQDRCDDLPPAAKGYRHQLHAGIAQDTLKKMGYLKVENYGSLEQARKLLPAP